MRTTFTIFALVTVCCAHATLGVVPPAYTSTGGTGTFLYMVTTPRTYQLIISANQLTSFVGENLNGLSWRLPNSAVASWPPVDINFAGFDIFVGPGVAPSAASTAGTASNYTGAPVQVRSGALTMTAGSFAFGGTPNSFGPLISFNDYLYTGGNLAIEVRHTGFTGSTTSRSFDALLTSTAGYGTDFAARWIGNNTGVGTLSQGNFFVTQLSSAPVPEPASMIALGLGAAALLRRKRRK